MKLDDVLHLLKVKRGRNFKGVRNFDLYVLMFQVIFGYVLLGALVTRLAVLFTSDGPAGSFTEMDKATNELLAKMKE